jgi:hypothetical protein
MFSLFFNYFIQLVLCRKASKMIKALPPLDFNNYDTERNELKMPFENKFWGD